MSLSAPELGTRWARFSPSKLSIFAAHGLLGTEEASLTIRWPVSGAVAIRPDRARGAEGDQGLEEAGRIEASAPLEDASWPHVHATRVAPVASRVDVHPFAGSPRNTDFSDGRSAQPKGGPHAHPGDRRRRPRWYHRGG